MCCGVEGAWCDWVWCVVRWCWLMLMCVCIFVASYVMWCAVVMVALQCVVWRGVPVVCGVVLRRLAGCAAWWVVVA